jgi:uncharacterized membrane protein YfcA
VDITGGPLYWAILIFAGLACGFLNTLASSGSAVSLPLLVMLGLSDSVANATNRLPILVGGVIATVTFARKGEMDWPAAVKLGVPAIAGAILGVVFAEILPNKDTGYLITGAVLLAFIMLFTKTRQALAKQQTKPPQVTPLAMALMLGVGFWAGLIVLDGATYALLVLMLVCSFPLARANAIKSFILVVTTAVAIAMFASDGEMRFAEGAVLSLGSVVGGYFGARVSSLPSARKWAFRLLILAISLELVHTFWHYIRPE